MQGATYNVLRDEEGVCTGAEDYLGWSGREQAASKQQRQRTRQPTILGWAGRGQWAGKQAMQSQGQRLTHCQPASMQHPGSQPALGGWLRCACTRSLSHRSPGDAARRQPEPSRPTAASATCSFIANIRRLPDFIADGLKTDSDASRASHSPLSLKLPWFCIPAHRSPTNIGTTRRMVLDQSHSSDSSVPIYG